MTRHSYFRYSAVAGLVIGYVGCMSHVAQYVWFMPDNIVLSNVTSIVTILLTIGALWLYKHRYAISPFTVGLGMRTGMSIALVRGVMVATCYYIICTADTEYLEQLLAIERQTWQQSGLPEAQASRAIEEMQQLMQPAVAFVLDIVGALLEGAIVTAVAVAFMRVRETNKK